MSRPSYFAILYLAACTALALCQMRVARAEDLSGESEAHLRRGVELRRIGNNAEALQEFQDALALEPTPRTRAQIALALHALGRWLDAERGLVEAIDARNDPWIAKYRDVLEGALLTVRAHLGWVEISANVTEGQLLVGGMPARGLPVLDALRVVAGTVEIEVRVPEHLSARTTVAVPSSGTVRVKFVLEPRPAKTAPTLDPASPAAAGVDAKRAPGVAQPQAATRRRIGAYIAFSATSILAASGVVAWVVREDRAAIYNDDSRCRVGAPTRGAQCSGYADTAKSMTYVEIGAFAGAACAAALGAWLLARSARGAASFPRTARAPAGLAGSWCAPTSSLGITCGGRF